MFVCVCMCVCVDGRANSFPTSTALVCQSSACCTRHAAHTRNIRKPGHVLSSIFDPPYHTPAVSNVSFRRALSAFVGSSHQADMTPPSLRRRDDVPAQCTQSQKQICPDHAPDCDPWQKAQGAGAPRIYVDLVHAAIEIDAGHIDLLGLNVHVHGACSECNIHVIALTLFSPGVLYVFACAVPRQGGTFACARTYAC